MRIRNPERKCIENSCQGRHFARGYCSKHYQHHYQNGRLQVRPPCSISECNTPTYGHTLFCYKHYTHDRYQRPEIRASHLKALQKYTTFPCTRCGTEVRRGDIPKKDRGNFICGTCTKTANHGGIRFPLQNPVFGIQTLLATKFAVSRQYINQLVQREMREGADKVDAIILVRDRRKN